MKRILTLTVAALLLAFAATPAAHADSFSYSLDDPIQTANPGDTVYFYATLFNHGSSDSVFIYGDSYTVDTPLALDDSFLYFGFPASLAPGENDDNVLFTVTLPPDIATGTYFGTFSLFGGSDSNATDFLGYDNFSITTVASPSLTPEPSALVLLGTGLVAIAAILKRRRSSTFGS